MIYENVLTSPPLGSLGPYADPVYQGHQSNNPLPTLLDPFPFPFNAYPSTKSVVTKPTKVAM